MYRVWNNCSTCSTRRILCSPPMIAVTTLRMSREGQRDLFLDRDRPRTHQLWMRAVHISTWQNLTVSIAHVASTFWDSAIRNSQIATRRNVETSFRGAAFSGGEIQGVEVAAWQVQFSWNGDPDLYALNLSSTSTYVQYRYCLPRMIRISDWLNHIALK